MPSVEIRMLLFLVWDFTMSAIIIIILLIFHQFSFAYKLLLYSICISSCTLHSTHFTIHCTVYTVHGSFVTYMAVTHKSFFVFFHLLFCNCALPNVDTKSIPSVNDVRSRKSEIVNCLRTSVYTFDQKWRKKENYYYGSSNNRMQLLIVIYRKLYRFVKRRERF